MTDIRRIDPGPLLSEASVYGDRMYLSGMIPEDTSQDITGQVKQALAQLPLKWNRSAAPLERKCVVRGVSIKGIVRPADSSWTDYALGEIDALLAKGGSDKTKILSAVIWLADIGDFAAMNAVWKAWVVPGQTPACATVQAKLNDPKMKVEIMVVAAL